MTFLTETEPPRGIAIPVLDGIRRIVARNRGPMTYHGTNTYLIDAPGGVAVLDPGPLDEEHALEVRDAAGAPITHILITHAHHDHIGNAAALQALTGAPVYAYPKNAVGIVPDVPLHNGDEIIGMTCLHTPGHAPDHLCFLRPDGIVFSGDHVMSWRSTVVSPPHGSMAAYMNSIRLLLDRGGVLYLPGHGPPLPDPMKAVRKLYTRRSEREREVVAALAQTPRSVADMADELYGNISEALRPAAERNLTAHLIKLAQDGLAIEDDGLWRSA
ncbi:MBL fold metallo-hydrolase [Shinella sp.]|uniref:MBL fold metallo-hydrolase n=1 Tax=Shinella sp. TaxID=1870904 RepID=UPI003F70FD15